jgi:hypothetical protein
MRRAIVNELKAISPFRVGILRADKAFEMSVFRRLRLICSKDDPKKMAPFLDPGRDASSRADHRFSADERSTFGHSQCVGMVVVILLPFEFTQGEELFKTS